MRLVGRLVAAIVIAAILLTMFGGVSILSRRQRDPGSRSTYSTGPGGLAALYRLVGAMGYEVSRSRTPLDRVKEPPRILVLAEGGIAPGRRHPGGLGGGSAGWERALGLARAGSTLVLLGAADLPGIEEQIGLSRASAPGRARSVHPAMGDVRVVTVHALRPRGNDWVVLMANGTEPVGLARAYGKGWLVAFADAAPFTNEQLGEADHAEAAIRLIGIAARGARSVAFEETIHGAVDDQSGSLWGRIGRPGRTLVYHALLLFGVLAVAQGSRLGYPASRRRQQPPLGDYVVALARLYGEAGLAGPALQAIRQDALRRAGRLLRLPPSASEETILQAMPEKAKQIFEAQAGSPYERLSATEAVRRCRELDAAVNSLRAPETS